jgi:hypothetical protein
MEFEPARRPIRDPLMGWLGSSDPDQQIRLFFPSKARAVAFAERHAWRYAVKVPPGQVRLSAPDLSRPLVRPASLADIGQWHPVMWHAVALEREMTVS